MSLWPVNCINTSEIRVVPFSVKPGDLHGSDGEDCTGRSNRKLRYILNRSVEAYISNQPTVFQLRYMCNVQINIWY